jgi:two-component system sensor histidine kinase ChvG
MSKKPGESRQSRAQRRQERRVFSPLTRRILAVNVVALGILGGGLLYLGEYRRNLIDAELTALAVQGEMFAAALGEGAVVANNPSGHQLASEIANQIVRRLVETTGTRARLFGNDGGLVADSRRLIGLGSSVRVEELPPPGNDEGFLNAVLDVYDRLMRRVTGRKPLEVYRETTPQHARDYPEVIKALSGESVRALRSAGGDRMVLSAAVPVQRYKHVLGALMLTRGSQVIDVALLKVRLDILKIFGVALAVTVLLSIYLAGTIARPIRRLAAAAERVRHDHGRKQTIPDFAGRDDEIGDLAESLSDMTASLWQRMDAIERFAADVAHEIKNPLTSLRSAVETATRLKDPEQQRKLMAIIQEDVTRLDRLISDISDASRLDAELSRAENQPVDLGAMMGTLVNIHETTAGNGPRIDLKAPTADVDPLIVNGIEGRLAQVFRNLLANAVSFSPGYGTITITAARDDGWVTVDIEDDGPGIPAGKEQAIFDRFYTERPESEKFGIHSGLGLSISRQIVEAHGGRITAANRLGGKGDVVGACFRVRLPAA